MDFTVAELLVSIWEVIAGWTFFLQFRKFVPISVELC